MAFTISNAVLEQAATKYRAKLLMLPGIGLEEARMHMTPYRGITKSQVLPDWSNSAQLRPYDGNNNETETSKLGGRELDVFLGSCVELFDPNALLATVYAQLESSNGKISDAELAKAMMFAMQKSIMENVNKNLFGATRNATGTTTADLFNGFDTITATEETATNISAANNNFEQLAAAIDNTNAFDTLRGIWKNAPEDLRAKNTKLLITYDQLFAYQEDYMTTVGSAPFNTKFEQMFLEGSGGKCQLVPMVSKTGSNYIHLTTKRNLCYGYGAGDNAENIKIRQGDNAFKLQYVALMFFGTQFATLDPKEFYVAKKFGA